MKVSDAVLSRSSIRAFTNKTVDNDLIQDLLITSSRAASGGNLQPWKIFVINGSSMDSFLEFQRNWTQPEIPAYDIYPPKLKEPYSINFWVLEERIKRLELHK
jgi:nitroreductase